MHISDMQLNLGMNDRCKGYPPSSFPFCST